MRICLYTESALPMIGGQETAVDALARQFIAQGHEPVVLAPRPRHGASTRDDRLPYPVERHPRYVSTRRFVAWYAWYLGKVYRKHRFDVLHCHSVYPAGYVASRWSGRGEIPLVITSHCGDVCSSSRLLAKPGLPSRFALALGQADAVIAISPYVERRIRQLGPTVKRIERISNGVHLAQYSTFVLRPPGLDERIRPGRYFLFLSRLVHRKGADLLIDAFSAIASGDNDLAIVIAGAGPEEEKLKSTAVRLALEDRVHFAGHVEGLEKRYLLRNSLCMVIPSRISEGFPLVLLESLAAGRPVIGTRIPGLADLIDDGQAGLLVDPDSPAALASALKRAASEPLLMRQLAARSRRRVADRDWSRVAAEHLAVFDELIHARARLRAA